MTRPRDRSRVAQELPPQVLAWLTQHASPDTWDALARDVAVAIAVELLVDSGAGAWDWEIKDMLRASASPTVRALVETLPPGRSWTPHTVAGPICQALELYGAERALRDAVRIKTSGLAASRQVAEPPTERP